VPEGRVIGFDLQTVISIAISLFSVAVLAFILSKLLYNPVRNYMSARSERIRSQLEGVNKQEQSINALKAEYERKIKDIEIEKEEILQAVRKVASENSNRILDEAKAEADSIRAHASDAIELERERTKDEMKRAIIEISTAMTEKLITISVDKELQERLFAETMAELEEVRWQS